MSATVTLIPPVPEEPRVELQASLSLREAALLLAVLSKTNGSALTELYCKLAMNDAIDLEKERLTAHAPALPHIDIYSLEKQA